MKKYIVVFFITVMVVSAVLYAQKIYTEKTYINVVKPAKITIDDVVESDGKINSVESTKIISNSGVTDKIYKKAGDYVTKGEKILDVYEPTNIDSTKSVPYTKELTNEQYSELKNNYKGEIKEIVSTTDGYLTELNTTEQGIIREGSVLAIISNFSTLEILTSISETKIHTISPGQNVQITGEAFPDKVYYGKVKSISPIAKQNTLGASSGVTIDVSISILNADKFLRPGNSAKVKILVNSYEDVLILPYECVITENEDSYVYVIQNNKAVKRSVTTGKESNYGIEILSGVSVDEIVSLTDVGENSKKITPLLEENKK